MTDEAYGATVAKRRLSRRLLQLRVQSGYTANHVCDMLNWGRGKVGRFEANQWKRPEMSDIRDLLRIYDVADGEREQLEELAIQARARPWWRDYSDIFENEFAGLRERCQPDPGVHAAGPARAAADPGLRRGLHPHRATAAGLAPPGAGHPVAPAGDPRPARRHRPGADRRDHRGVLAVPVGLAIGAARPDRASGRHQPAPQHRSAYTAVHRWPAAGSRSAINIFDFAEGEPSIAFTETDFAVVEVSEPDQVSRYIQSFEKAVDGALEPSDTAIYLRQLADQLE